MLPSTASCRPTLNLHVDCHSRYSAAWPFHILHQKDRVFVAVHPLKISAKRRIIRVTGDFLSATLKPVAHKGYWRVKLAWPNRHHFFGKFLSLADKWIEEHRWLTDQRQKSDAKRIKRL
jgi:hypothetical protein